MFSRLKNQNSKNSLKKNIFNKLELLKLEERITPAVNLNPFIQLPEHNLVIITQDLLSKVPQQELANATVVTLDPAQDIIRQISNQFANRSDVDSIRIISHGKDGELLFGNQVVDQNILVNRGSEIASWGKALAPDADILLYGCSVAASESGKNFVATLAGLTGADVAASTNPTGAGADTNLEYNAGLVTAGLQATQVAWNKSSIQLDQQEGPLYFTDDGTSVTITGYNGPGGAVNIPAFLNNLPVTTIGVNAFINKVSITSINIPNSVTIIGNSAFSGCSGLTSITLPNSLITIGDYAFGGGGCFNLTSINIPASVTSIGFLAFQNCWNVTAITFAANSSLTTIGGAAFAGCGITSITLPASVSTIGDNAFLDCRSLVTISFQGNAPSISLNTFTSAGATRTIYYIATSSGWSNLFGGIPTICATSTNKLAVINNSLGAGDSSSITLFEPSTGLPIGVVVPFPGYIGEIRITSGDVDGDGILDLVAGAGPGGGPAIVVINSITGAVSQSFFAFDPNFRGGVFVALRDINGDSILDIIVGAGAGGGPEVRVFDGRTNSILKSFFAYDVGFRGGVSVATLDFNGDGILDLVTGAGAGGAPHVKVFDGATGVIISQWYAYSIDFLGGVFVAAGDIGNDGRIEVVTGPGSGSPPLVRVWDPLTATMLAQFYAYSEEFNGGVRVGVSDGNFDGILDLITGAGEGGGPEVKGFSFPQLDLLFSFFSGEETNTTGVFVS